MLELAIIVVALSGVDAIVVEEIDDTFSSGVPLLVGTRFEILRIVSLCIIL
jgi:hypothetical protein